MFHTNLDTRQVGMWETRTVHQLLYPLLFSAWGLIRGIVPAWFYTDFASVPRHFGLYEMFGGRCNKESVPHDYIYRIGSILLIDWHEFDLHVAANVSEIPLEVAQWLQSLYGQSLTPIPKFVGDHIFRKLMIEEGESQLLYDPMYEAVHKAGDSSFNKFQVMDPLPMDVIDKVIPVEWGK